MQHVLKLEGLSQNYQVFLDIQNVSQWPLRHTHLCNNVQLTPSADFASALKLPFPLSRQGCSRAPLISSRPYSSPQLSLLPPQTRCLGRQPTGAVHPQHLLPLLLCVAVGVLGEEELTNVTSSSMTVFALQLRHLPG